MYSLLFLGISAFLFSLFLTPLVRNYARKWGFVDLPDHGRKAHERPIPRVGGVSIAVAYLLSYIALWMAGFAGGHQIMADGIGVALRVAPAAGLIFLIGLWDDLRTIKPWQKFAGQVVAAVIVYFAGVHVQGFGGFQMGAAWSLPATVFWLVLCTNAVNLIDGVDGLATGVGLFATATTLLAAMLQNNIDLAWAVAPLLGCLLGFLRYNFNPATIFLGDSGSLLIGFLLGCYSIIWSQKSATILGMTAPLLALAIPLLDTGLAVLRRFLRRQPLFTGDRGHIHHRLLDRGWSPRRVALMVYGLCMLSAIFALGVMNKSFQGVAIILFCGMAWVGIQHLGYVEFGVAGHMFVEGAFRRALNTNIALRIMEERLRGAVTPDECWGVIEDSAKNFGFHTIEMALAGRMYSYRNGGAPERSWSVRIPLSGSEFIELTREFEAPSEHNVVAPYADAVRRTIAAKLGTFEEPKKAFAADGRR